MNRNSPPDDLYRRAKQILLPLLAAEDKREELLIDAFYLHDPLLHGIELKGSAGLLASKLIKKLLDYGRVPGGEHSLARLLLTVRYNCGDDKHAEIDELIGIANALDRLREHERLEPTVAPITPASPFLIQTIDTPRDQRSPTVFIRYARGGSDNSQCFNAWQLRRDIDIIFPCLL